MIYLTIIFLIFFTLCLNFYPLNLSEEFQDCACIIWYYSMIFKSITFSYLLSWLWKNLFAKFRFYCWPFYFECAKISSVLVVMTFSIKIFVFHFLIELACHSPESFLIFKASREFSSFQITVAPIFIFFFSLKGLFTILYLSYFIFQMIFINFSLKYLN